MTLTTAADTALATAWSSRTHPSGAGVAAWRAIGTDIRLAVADPAVLNAAKATVDTVLERLDEVASRFRADSELSRLNALAGDGGRFLLSAELREQVQASLAGARWSGGLLDPTVGDALVAAGYDRDLDALAEDDPRPARPGTVAGWRSVHLDGALLELDTGLRLDLGSTAKALGADQAAEAVAARCGCACLVAFGGDLAVASAGTTSWPVLVAEPAGAKPSAGDQLVFVGRGGVATSSTTRRRWRRAGVVQHHLIDPSTGAPVDSPYRTVSVAAPTCLEANIASTAALVAGSEAPSLLGRSGLPGRLVDRRGRVRLVGGWPAGDGESLPVATEPLLGGHRRTGVWWS